jgi:hypothetical protein
MMKWYEDVRWFDWLGAAGFALTVVGFYITWRQITKTRGAAEAATTAAGATQRQLASNQLLILVPQLRWIASELDAAIEGEDGDEEEAKAAAP